MKDWLTVIIVLLIVGIVLDGLRRMRLAKRENLRLSKNAQKADLGADIPVSTSEFPSGGARVAAYREVDDVENLNQTVKKKFESGKTARPQSQRIPEQVSLNLEESVPMLMDSVDDTVEDVEGSEAYREPSEPQIGSLEDLQDEEIALDESLDNDVSVEVRTPPKTQRKAEVATEKKREPEAAELEDLEEVLIVNVMAKPERRFHGKLLLESLMEQGLKLGEMDIFHRHQDDDGDGPIIFSLANMVVPGTFNLAEMDTFETPGISLFLSLPVATESIAAYNDMIATAKNLAEKLEGELKDENRSVMTSQTIEHGRQRVIEFERKKKLHT